MDAYEFNKIAGAVLFALLAIFGTKIVADLLFAVPKPDKPGYEIALETEGGTATEAKAEETVPLAELLKAADADRGQRVAKKCTACHTFDKGGANKVGPNLYAVVGRALGAVDGFAYSSALKNKGGNWGFAELDAFLAGPKKWLPGTKMAFAGVKKADQRANLLLYMRKFSDSPAPLPTE